MSWKQRRFGGCESAEEAGKRSEPRAQRILVLSVVLSEKRARLQPDGGFLLVTGHRGSRTNQKQNLNLFINLKRWKTEPVKKDFQSIVLGVI